VWKLRFRAAVTGADRKFRALGDLVHGYVVIPLLRDKLQGTGQQFFALAEPLSRRGSALTSIADLPCRRPPLAIVKLMSYCECSVAL
jgi:hypothetical protein